MSKDESARYLRPGPIGPATPAELAGSGADALGAAAAVVDKALALAKSQVQTREPTGKSIEYALSNALADGLSPPPELQHDERPETKVIRPQHGKTVPAAPASEHLEERAQSAKPVETLKPDETSAAQRAEVKEEGTPVGSEWPSRAAATRAAQARRRAAAAAQYPYSSKEGAFQGDLVEIAYWFLALGRAEEPIFGAVLEKNLPEQIQVKATRLGKVRAIDILPADSMVNRLSDLLDLALLELQNPRAIEVLYLRTFADKPATLESLGKHLGVTRESVRQIEKKALAELRRAISSNWVLAVFDGYLDQTVQIAMPIRDLVAKVPALIDEVPSLRVLALNVLTVLDGSVELSDGWCVRGGKQEAKAATLRLLRSKGDAFGVVRLDRVAEVVLGSNDVEAMRAWAQYCGFVTYRDYVFSATGSVGDYAASILSVLGEPMSVPEITAKFAYDRASRSLANALANDSRFTRVNKDLWGLRSWGLEEYAGIREEITDQLHKHGGTIPVWQLAQQLVEKFGVSDTSVRAYAVTYPFKTVAGVVSFAEDAEIPTADPLRAARLYRSGSGWVYRIKVNSEHLRGSGFPAPIAVATILELPPGSKITLRSQLGGLVVSYRGIAPVFGSIKRYLNIYGCQVGDEAFVAIRDDGTFDCHVAAKPTGNPLRDALALIGAPLTDNESEAQKLLAEAVGLDVGASYQGVLEAYEKRGDADVAAHLRQLG